jgi:type II secretory pathway component PulC
MLPEEKLLRLIRKDARRQGGDLPGSVPVKKPASGAVKRTYVSLLNIRSAVTALFVLSCGYLLWEVVYSFTGLNSADSISFSPAGDSGRELFTVPDVKPVRYYLDGMSGRQVFKVSTGGAGESPVGIAGSDSIRDFSLVGIISGERPQAIIQDNKTQKTYYLNKGQTIAEYMVEDILPDKVILNTGGQRYELFL